jgi:hypothetical protein
MDQLVDNYQPEQNRRPPALLRVLCMLTWTGSVVLFVVSVQAVLSFFDRLYGSPGSFHTTKYSAERTWMFWAFLGNIGGAVCCFAGSYLMWKLRRQGFYLYTFGQLVPTAFTIFVMLSFNGLKPFGVMLLWGYCLLCVSFVIAYALNLKYMDQSDSTNRTT